MKFIIALAFLVAGISALPQPEDASLQLAHVDAGRIEDAIHDAAQYIRDAGLDPFHISREVKSYALPVPVIFNATAVVEDVLSFGLSNIRIYTLIYNVFSSRLEFDLEMPDIHLGIGHASAEVTVFGEKLNASTSGTIDIYGVHVVGQATIRGGLISAPTVRSVTLDFNVGSIYSHLNVIIQHHDFSDLVNIFLGSTVPNTVYAFKDDINHLLEIYLFDFIAARL